MTDPVLLALIKKYSGGSSSGAQIDDSTTTTTSTWSSQKINETIEEVQEKIENGDLAGPQVNPYPVGAIYISWNSTSPASLFGGSWEAINNFMLFASGGNYVSGQTGGHIHQTLYISNLPPHSHIVTMARQAGDSVAWGTASALGRYSGDPGGASFTMNTSSTGSATEFEIMPPFLVVNMWKRVA